MVLFPVVAAIIMQANWIANDSFQDGFKGWSPIWEREKDKVEAKIVPGYQGKNAVRITHSGSLDWSLAQDRHIPVKAGQILHLSARLKSEDLSNASIGLVTRDVREEVLDWNYAAISISGTQDWHLRSPRRVIVPEGCTSVQFRLIGSGPGQVWMQEASLSLAGSLSNRPADLKPATLDLGDLALEVNTDGSLAVSDRKAKRQWRYAALPSQLQVTDLRTGVESTMANGVSRGKTILMKVWDAANDLDLSVTIKSASGFTTPRRGFDLSIQGEGTQDQHLPFPGQLLTNKGEWLVIPMNEGILFPVDDKEIQPMNLIAYGGHGISMPWAGVIDPPTGAGAMSVFVTPDDASLQINRFDQSNLSMRTLFEPSKGQFAYPRRLHLLFESNGGYVSLARAYRRHAQEQGLVQTLRSKLRRNPNVDKLIGAINVWNWDMDKVALCQEMKRMGIDRVLWSSGGSAEEIRRINGLGYLGGRYDIYQDVWDPKNALEWQMKEGWPDDLVLLPNGDWMKGWSHPEKQPDGTTKWYQGGVICSKPGLDRAKKHIPDDLKKVPYQARFIDTTTASPWRECYNPKHPLTRSEDRHFKMRLLDFISRDSRQVAGSETGIDSSVPYVHYYEGMLSLGPYRLPDSGTDMMGYRKPTAEFLKYQIGPYYRLPLWELVYHDCVVSQWYWGDASNKAPEVWDDRNLWNILYGTSPLVMFDKAKWGEQKDRILKTYRDVCETIRPIGYDQMLSHEFLNRDHTLQRTRWSSGQEIVVNFSDKAQRYFALTLPPKGFTTGRSGSASRKVKR